MENMKNNVDTPIYTFGCIMLDFESNVWEAKRQTIDADDLYIVDGDSSYGLESDCHVTILYGLHDTVSPDDVKSYLKPLELYSANMVGLSLFENPKFDVLKYDIVCPQANITYEEIKRFLPNTQTFDNYSPHMTVAYLKPGTGKKYLEYMQESVAIIPYRFSMSSPKYGKTFFDNTEI